MVIKIFFPQSLMYISARNLSRTCNSKVQLAVLKNMKLSVIIQQLLDFKTYLETFWIKVN